MNVRDIEYQIRKYERGLRVLMRDKPHPMQEASHKHKIKSYANEMGRYKKMLHEITGSSTPSIPRWPL
tara:strand:+ start:3393 stop:3596 length:204 start_codon:yes stop_codon:yes gene_type:complete